MDLLQLHNLVDPQEWETALRPGGALEAAVQAREQGLVRFIGVTGHGLTAAAMHRQALERFDFNSVLLPFSYLMAQNQAYYRDFMNLQSVCQARNVAVQTIKSAVHRPWGEQAPTRATWYHPLENQADIDRTVHWVLGHSGLFLNSAGDVHILPKVLDAANRYVAPPTDDEMQAQVDMLGMQPLFPEIFEKVFHWVAWRLFLIWSSRGSQWDNLYNAGIDDLFTSSLYPKIY